MLLKYRGLFEFGLAGEGEEKTGAPRKRTNKAEKLLKTIGPDSEGPTMFMKAKELSGLPYDVDEKKALIAPDFHGQAI
jgi:hypothetical protein